MRARLDEPAFANDEDPISVLDRGEAVCDGDCGPSLRTGYEPEIGGRGVLVSLPRRLCSERLARCLPTACQGHWSAIEKLAINIWGELRLRGVRTASSRRSMAGFPTIARAIAIRSVAIAVSL